jgi:hypothetical protein
MAQQFSMHQRNNLLIGNHLMAECPAPSPSMRRFINVWGYLPPQLGKRRIVSKILNVKNQDELRFSLDYYDVHAAYIDSYDADYYTTYLIKQRDITGIEQLEQAVLAIIDDLAHLGRGTW